MAKRRSAKSRYEKGKGRVSAIKDVEIIPPRMLTPAEIEQLREEMKRSLEIMRQMRANKEADKI